MDYIQAIALKQRIDIINCKKKWSVSNRYSNDYTHMELRESMMENEPEPFAVDLSNDGIFLWHRKPEKKWEFLGSVPLNSGNLREQLEDLSIVAKNAGAPSNHAIVRIPTAEVQTLSVDQDGDDDTDMETRIIAALEAASGEDITSLAFDIDRQDAPLKINIAWTPLAVIEQATTFVNLIGFHPTQYTTDLDVSVFPRNPNFQPADYTKSPETIVETDSGYQQDETPEIIQTEEPETDIQPTKTKKAEIEPIWFVALLFIIALIIAAIYFWPHYDLSVIFGSNFGANQHNFAVTGFPSAIHFV
jgi:hypothetical protein